jgi:hypothetical protein
VAGRNPCRIQNKTLYKDEQIQIDKVLDDQCDAPLTYVYDIISNVTGREILMIDVRKLDAFKEYFGGERPDHFQFFKQKTTIVPAVIKAAIENGEITI